MTPPFPKVTRPRQAEQRRRLGIMGGTFDPIHHGHLVAASEVAAEFDLDEVVFVPTGQPWQKADRQVTPAEHRYLLTVIATASNPRFTVSRVDIDRGGKTYTIDTLRDFARLYPNDDLFFITGADAMAQIMSWKNVEELWELAHFVSVTRPGYSSEDFGRENQISLMEIPAMAISSTDLGTGQRSTSRSGIWSPTGWCSTSVSISSTSRNRTHAPWLTTSGALAGIPWSTQTRRLRK